MRRFPLGDFVLEVEHRRIDGGGGPTLRVRGPAPGERELLRFDCFARGAHYHVDPAGRDEVTSLAEQDDPVAWTARQLERDLAGWLEKAGADASRLPAEGGEALRRAEAALRNPPAALDDLDPARLQRRRSEKWNTYPDDVLPVWVAEMDFPVAEPIRAVLADALEDSDLGYPIAARDTGLREAFCDRMHARFGWHVEPTDVEVLSDVVQGIYWACTTFHPDRPGVVVQTPIYPPFLRVVRDTGRRLLDHRWVRGAERFELDLDALRGFGGDTGLLLLCNPHNPTGRVLERGELEALAEWVLERDVWVVSDEIHADLVFDGRRHVPFGSLSPEIAARTLTLTSATKAFNIPGLRCAVAHFGSRALRRRFQSLPRHLAGGLGLPGLYATLAAWRHADPWLDEVRAYLQANREFLAAELPRRFPGIRCHAPESTYLAWLDCAGLGLTEPPVRRFYEAGRVALTDGGLFGEGYGHFARLNFATSRALLGEALDRMEHALA